ncbi:UPF0149 family protein [Pusillimonas minor]|uniref:UPF0149 family protein n=1 Tax=Pusillimonas minor TaxID=2697024 RepID=A0A842HLP4_9BURK|nr:UPF0149 family protein [Pusillimonas minor]MBC2768448.1 UPF0149 family protein [Pusillimonas minor]
MKTNTLEPLSEAELAELDKLLLYDIDTDDAMTLDMLDGFLHAIAIGPTTIHPAKWLPFALGLGGPMPPKASMAELNRVMDLVMRHYNGIISGLQSPHPEMTPTWAAQEYRGKMYDTAEGWAYGFVEGMNMCQDDWQPMLDTEKGAAWFRPIGLLGADDFSPDQDDLTKTPAQRAKITQQIPPAVLNMYLYWLPYREAIYEREIAKASKPKVGRNEPCPCGSGKKFKKCCGAGDALH